MKNKIVLTLLSITIGLSSYSQINQHKYRRQILHAETGWYNIELPIDIYQNLNPNFNDVRIIGITETNDTIEAPYILEELRDVSTNKSIRFRTRNRVRAGNRYFSYLVLNKAEVINQVQLAFSENNFDLRVSLEGSYDKLNWFEVLSDYRLVGISNKHVDYTFSTLNFIDTDFIYYRVSWVNEKEIRLKSAIINNNIRTNGATHNFNKTFTSNIDKTDKTTKIDIKLNKVMPVAQIYVEIKNQHDYYRPVNINYLADSVKINGKWSYQYRLIQNGVISSLEKRYYTFSKILTDRLQVVIHNNDNEPLTIQDIKVRGFKNSLTTRITEPANYYLYYGNENSTKPNYDIVYFRSNIPDNLINLNLGSEECLIDVKSPANKKTVKMYWLWLVMGIIVIVLGAFTIRMIKNT